MMKNNFSSLIDKIISVLVLLSAMIMRFSVSIMLDFFFRGGWLQSHDMRYRKQCYTRSTVDNCKTNLSNIVCIA